MPQAGDPRTQTSTAWVKVNGQALPPAVAARIAEVSIEQDLVLPDAFMIRLHDVEDAGSGQQTRFPTANSNLFEVGQDIEIGMGREEQPRSNLKGEVTSIDLEARADGLPMLTVRGYDKAHRLNRVKKTRSFENKTYSDIVAQVSREYGLTSKIDSTNVVYDYFAQDGQTDWELLRALARKSGYEVFTTGNQIHFRKPNGSERAPDQEFGVTLRHLRLRMSAASQVKEVEVRGWDPMHKAVVVGIASSPGSTSSTDQGHTGGALAARAFGSPGRYVLTNRSVRSQTEATGLAQAILDEIAGAFVQFDCTCLGEANLRPGRSVTLKGVGPRFNKEYYISTATHRNTPEQGYLTQVTVSGRQPTSLTALLGGNGHAGGAGAPAAARGGGAAHSGVVIGLVSNNKDPDMGGRIKVKFPWLGDQVESAWARIATPMAGNGRGFYWLPEVNDEVLLAFEHGDINFPFVVGYVWNGTDRVPSTAAQVIGGDGKVKQRIIKTTSGHTVTFDDSPDSPSITIVDKTAKNKIHLDSKQNKITITVEGDMDLLASKGNINLKGRTVNVEASDSLRMKGTQTQVEGTSTMKVRGATTDVEANAKLSLNGGGMTEVKGGLIKLN
jgi:phage protein D/phage baseplate assembly protein gpV